MNVIRSVINSTICLHGDKSQAFRDRVMQNFRSGRFRVFVATDVAPRGLDVKDISVAINYDFPDKGVEDYIHRIGRTARGGQSGLSFTFITQKDARSGHLTELIVLVKRSGQQVPPEMVSLGATLSLHRDSHAHGALSRIKSTHRGPPRQYGSVGGREGWKLGASRSAPQYGSDSGYGDNCNSSRFRNTNENGGYGGGTGVNTHKYSQRDDHGDDCFIIF